MSASSSDTETPKKKDKRVRRLIEATVIAAACTYMGVMAFRKITTSVD